MNGTSAAAGSRKLTISLRLRIVLLLFVILAAVIVMTGMVLALAASADNALRRVQVAHLQYEAASQLSERANAYSEQIAETLLLGPSERDDYSRSRARIVQAFAHLRVRIEDGMLDLPEGPQREREVEELRAVESMLAIYRQLEATAERAFAADFGGDREQAIRIFSEEIEDGLDLRLQRAIRVALVAEAEELALADAEFRRTADRTLAIVVGAALLLLAVSVAAGWALYHAVMRPVRALTAGASAVEAGRLDHRIPLTRRDELGRLAERFNEMTAELDRQREVLLDASRALEGEVAERTAELQAANQRLREVDEQRVAFLADVSHELRTPLTALRSEAEIGLRGMKSEAAYRESLSRIVQQAIEMGRLIEDLLFIARSDSGQIRFDPRRLTLDELIRPAVRAAETLAESRGVELVVEPPPVAAVVGDPRRLSQALLVLLDNAVRYSAAGDRVELAARTGPDSVEVVVRDEGVGLDPAEAPHLFERFFRGRGGVEMNPGGSGLGLPIALWIARQHGGELRLTPRPSGVEAVLRLPRSGLEASAA